MKTQEDLLPEIRQAWADVLGSDSAESVPLDTNFLEAGGNSLLLVMLWEELAPLAAGTLKLSQLFQHATVRAQAKLLSGTADAPAPAAPAAPDQRSLLARRRAAAVPSRGGTV